MNNVIVTGATGFIGRSLVEELRRRYPDATIVALGTDIVDLADEKAVWTWAKRLSRTFKCEHIIHLAALYKAGDWPVHHPATQFNVNLAINVNVLEMWRQFFPQAKLTSILSYCMYPSTEEPHAESALWGHEPHDYLFSYVFTKKALLVGQRAYRQQYGLTGGSVVLPTIYGANDSFAENSHVVGALVGKFVRAARVGAATVEVWGTGEQEREFLFVEDAVDGIIEAALRSDLDVVNLGAGEAHSIRNIAEWIKAAANFRGEIVFNHDRFTGVRKRMLDSNRVHEHLGWSAGTPIVEGLKRTVEWYNAELDRQEAKS